MNLRKPILAALGAAILTLALPQAAQGGSFLVRQCDQHAPAHTDVPGMVNQGGGYRFFSRCANAGPDNGLQLRWPTSQVEQGATRHLSWTLPAGLELQNAFLEWRAGSAGGHVARIWVSNRSGGSGQTLVNPSMGSNTGGWRGNRFDFSTPGPARLLIQMRCSWQTCSPNDGAYVWARSIRPWVRDISAPRFTSGPSGSLVSGDWKRGSVSLAASAADQGSGVHRMSVRINGTSSGFGSAISCGGLNSDSTSRVWSPCPSSVSGSASYDTARSPWREGTNSVSLCVYDYATSGAANNDCRSYTVSVDNVPPSGAFLAPSPADPELIRVRASDATSGVDGDRSLVRYRPEGSSAWSELETELAGGELRGRVDSENAAPGKYEWEARIYDRAGNLRVTRERIDGHPMVVSFPMRESVRLPYRLENGQRKAVIGYAARRRVRGRMLDSEGQPISKASVRVVERMAGRARPKRRVTVRETGEDGAFALRLGRGPSRRVWVEYAGSRRYRPASPPRRLAIKVRGRAGLRPIKRRARAGERVAFGGRIGRRGMVLPANGKLYELQVKAAARRWITVGKARRSRPDGRFRATHRFGPQPRPTRFIFRVRVMRERGWGYAPSRSRGRRVTVRPRG